VTVPPDPRPHYADPTELAALLGVPPDSPRLERVCSATDAVVDAYYGSATVASRLPPDQPWPAVVVEAATVIAEDVWRRISLPGGYFQVADYVGRLSRDPADPVAVLLDALGRESWPVA
jgi:hypothetical protein